MVKSTTTSTSVTTMPSAATTTTRPAATVRSSSHSTDSGRKPEPTPTHSPRLIRRLSGIFAFALYDVDNDSFLIARDPIGVIPLYIGYDPDGRVYVASELKALEGQCDHYEPFLPGHYYWSGDPGQKRYYKRPWMDNITRSKDELSYGQAVEEVRISLMDAVKRQLMSDVPYGVLLSGGLDSSVISAIAEKFAGKRIEDGGSTPAWWPRLHSFAVGLKGGSRPGKGTTRGRAYRYRSP